jgi:hypothetical protein
MNNMLLVFLKFIHTCSPTRIKSVLSRLLAYAWKRESGEGHLPALLKSIGNWILAHFPLLYFLRLIQYFCSEEPWYPIEYEIVLTTTRVIFTRSKQTTQHICLKLWQRSEDEVCNDKLVIRSEDYLLEGLEFNRKFAKDVYLGIAPVTLSEDTKKIRRGRLIKTPKKKELEERVKYALIMRCLNEHWRLDYQLRQSWWSMEVSIDFLAKEVARMHERLEKPPGNYGTPGCISSKLNLNSELFVEALGQLSNGQNNLEKYGWISDLNFAILTRSVMWLC